MPSFVPSRLKPVPLNMAPREDVLDFERPSTPSSRFAKLSIGFAIASMFVVLLVVLLDLHPELRLFAILFVVTFSGTGVSYGIKSVLLHEQNRNVAAVALIANGLIVLGNLYLLLLVLQEKQIIREGLIL